MDILGELNKPLKTIMSIDNHPASELKPKEKQSYLNCIAMIAIADENFLPVERGYIKDLADSIGSPQTHVENAIRLAKNPDSDSLTKSLEVVSATKLSACCASDMIRIATCDDDFHQRENHYIDILNKSLGLSGKAYKTILKFINHINSGNGKGAEEVYNSEFSSSDINQAHFSYLLTDMAQVDDGYEDDNLINLKSDDFFENKKDNVCTENIVVESPFDSVKAQLIKSLQQETFSQLNKVHDIAQKALEGDLNIDETRNTIEAICQKIKDEKDKVNDLRLTLAFVGTMKAGKSTTINAIVGSEILPNRTGAMTTLPTVITHVAKQTQPELLFPVSKPFNDALSEIKKANIVDAEGKPYEKTLEAINTNVLQKIDSEYTGQSEIYNFMEQINDIARICADNDISNPLEQYRSMGDFPEITVEFAYLKDRVNSSEGKISLIDTPGPNEAGQGHLKGVVKQQLAQASAVVCVVDPFQVDSEAQAEVRNWINGARKDTDVPLYVFVNQIDRVAYNERTPEYIEGRAKNIFPDFIDNDIEFSVTGRVYPISSKNALLANLACRSLKEEQQIPSPENEAWVPSYLEQVYGGSWEEHLSSLGNVNEHTRKSSKMWDSSLMHKPMDEVIKSGLLQAGPACIRAAVRSMVGMINDLERSVKIPLQSINLEVKELHQLVKRLQINIDDLDRIKDESDKFKEASLSEVRKKLVSLFNELKSKANGSLENMAKSEKKKRKKKENAKDQKSIFSGLLNLLGSGKKDIERVLTEDSPITFSNEAEAEEFVRNVFSELGKQLKKNFTNAFDGFSKPLEVSMDLLQNKIEELINPVINNAKQSVEEHFSDIPLAIPKIKFEKPKLDLDLMELAGSQVTSVSTTKTRYESRWYSLWLMDHEVKYQGTDYVVNPQQIRHSIESKLLNSMTKVQKTVTNYLEDNFKDNFTDYFKSLNKSLLEINDSVKAGITLNQQSQGEKVKIAKKMNSMIDEMQSVRRRVDKTLKTIETNLEVN